MKSLRVPIRKIKDALRNPYTFPGAYPLQFVSYDGVLCHTCVRDNFRSVVRDTKDGIGGWKIIGVEVLWEGPAYCAQCSEDLESAYGNPSDSTFEE